ncbi:hypothetical protein T08_6423 [Trichinella sp. T8]|nr:hypothetical protein T08_6423 [Trichinella sp. T8]
MSCIRGYSVSRPHYMHISIFVAIVRKENLKAVHVISHFLIKVTVAVARLNRNATSPLPLGHCPKNNITTYNKFLADSLTIDALKNKVNNLSVLWVSNWADEQSTGDDDDVEKVKG